MFAKVESGPKETGFTIETPEKNKKEIGRLRREARRKRAEVVKLAEAEKTLDIILKGKGPHIILFLNDLHVGSDTVDEEKITAIVDFIEAHPNAYVVLLGDEIEGSKPEYRTIEGHRTGGIDEDIEDFQQLVLDRIGHRVIGAVGHFFGHTGWSQDSSGDNPWERMYGPYGIRVLMNGSSVNLNYEGENGETISTKIDVAHYFQGKSKVDYLHSQRERWKTKKKEKKPNAVASGHTHQAAVGAENYPDAPTQAILIQSGAFKGNSPHLPADPFASKAGFGETPGQPGQMLILSKGGHRYRAINLPQGKMIEAAMDFWENENLAAIEAADFAKSFVPEVYFRRKKSTLSTDSEDLLTKEEQLELAEKKNGDIETESEPSEAKIWDEKDLQPLYDKASFKVKTDWPSLFLPIANVRMGASYEGKKALDAMIKDVILKNPHILLAFMGNVVDKDVAKKDTRIDTLDDLISIIQTIGIKRVVALLLDSALRTENWRNEIEGLEYVPPGSYVSQNTGVPLIVGGSSIEIFHGDKDHTLSNLRHSIMALDGIKGHGSYSKALTGLTAYDTRFNDGGHDVLVSGLHPHSGAGTYEKDGRLVDLLDVGWLSPFDNQSGKKNVQKTSPGGQGLIISGEMRIPTSTWSESIELFDAILALTAAKKLGIV
ncbi:hypothetical protein KA111_00780 [Candidatus Woesebacteria bacterium]|nr:hypothetical protein [Candidatus Woesebacteria bacterium]